MREFTNNMELRFAKEAININLQTANPPIIENAEFIKQTIMLALQTSSLRSTKLEYVTAVEEKVEERFVFQ